MGKLYSACGQGVTATPVWQDIPRLKDPFPLSGALVLPKQIAYCPLYERTHEVFSFARVYILFPDRQAGPLKASNQQKG